VRLIYEDRIPRARRTSPVKQQRSTNLTSIPESPIPRPRTEVRLTIDANGKARTETIVIHSAARTTRGGPSVDATDGWDSSPYESSSDDEPIIVPSRNSSFTFPSQPVGPKLARFETSRSTADSRRRRISAGGYSQTSSQNSLPLERSVESEAGIILESFEDNNNGGDATLALRKVLESRKSQVLLQSNHNNHSHNTRHHLFPSSQHYTDYSSLSPTTDGATPSSSRSGTTRCVCRQGEGWDGGLMIQCESCDNWLHAKCVGIDRKSLPPVYICAFCAQTPIARGRRGNGGRDGGMLSPLAGKGGRLR